MFNGEKYVEFYNTERIHGGIGYKTLRERYLKYISSKKRHCLKLGNRRTMSLYAGIGVEGGVNPPGGITCQIPSEALSVMAE